MTVILLLFTNAELVQVTPGECCTVFIVLCTSHRSHPLPPQPRTLSREEPSQTLPAGHQGHLNTCTPFSSLILRDRERERQRHIQTETDRHTHTQRQRNRERLSERERVCVCVREREIDRYRQTDR